MANWTAYRALKQESQTQGLPIHYRTDLTKHDRRRLSRKDAPDAFVWILRQSGTYLMELGNPGDLSWILAVYNTHGPRPTSGRQARWYLYRDDSLTYVAPQVARETFIQSVIGMPVRSTRSDLYLGSVVDVHPDSHNPTVYAAKVGDSPRGFSLNDVTITKPETPSWQTNPEPSPSTPVGRCPHCGDTIYKDVALGGAHCYECDNHLDPWEYA